MSRPRKLDWKAAVLQYLTALLMGMGMSLCALKALLPRQTLWPAMALCALLCLAFEAVVWLPVKRKWLLPLAAALALGVSCAFGKGPLYTAAQLVKAAFLSLRGIPDAAAPYADAARWTVCALFCLVAVVLAWDEALPLALFAVGAVVGLSFLLSGGEGLILCALPAAAGLLMLLARDNSRSLAALPLALVLAVGAFLLLPGRPEPLPDLKNAADSIRQFVEDYLLFNEYRTSFSLADEGYQPLDDRLGGPAEPENRSVMEVTTSRTVLLRGRAYNDYSGLNWYDTLSARRYLYVSSRFSALRDELFDLNRPLAGELPGLETIRIHMLNPGTTTLFAPQRTRTLQTESERMVLYYNLASELFLTRNMASGDSYTLTYLPFSPESAVTKAAVSACAALPDPHYAEVAEQYLALPGHIQQEVRDLALRITANAATPFDKALAIQDYLRSHYRYNLDVQSPPENVDFVAWFLLGTQEGYCTYFASAMTVLCRLAGLPARYVTGYLAVPDDTGVAVVTGNEAHAWTEVYLNGFGWLDFDATPRRDNDRSDDPSDSSPTPPPEAPSPTPTPTPDPITPTPPPEDQPSPEPTISQTPTVAPSDAPADSPTPPPGSESPAPSNAPPENQREDEQNDSSFPWWIVLLILALIGLTLWRFFATDPLRRAKRHPESAVEIYFNAICAMLALNGVARKPQETLRAFGVRADQALAETGLPALSPLTESYAAQVYGNHPADSALFQQVYQAFWANISFGRRLKAVARRMIGKKTGC